MEKTDPPVEDGKSRPFFLVKPIEVGTPGAPHPPLSRNVRAPTSALAAIVWSADCYFHLRNDVRYVLTVQPYAQGLLVEPKHTMVLWRTDERLCHTHTHLVTFAPGMLGAPRPTSEEIDNRTCPVCASRFGVLYDLGFGPIFWCTKQDCIVHRTGPLMFGPVPTQTATVFEGT